MRAALLIAAATLGLASAASAASVGLDLDAGYTDLTQARQSAKAIFGSTGGLSLGGALRLDLGNHWFMRAGASFLHKTGERVIVQSATGPVFPLGHPLEMHVMPAYFDLGFQLMPHHSLRPYLGLGAGIVSFKEESTIAGLVVCGPNPDLSGATGDQSCSATRKFSSRGFLGLRYGHGHVQIGVEGAYALTPNVIGDGLSGVSKIYGETGLGGWSATGILTLKP